MPERLSSRLKSKTGFVGLLIFLIGAVRTILSLLQDFEYTRENVGWVVDFLNTPLGNAAVTTLGIILILWALHRHQSKGADSESESAPTTPQTTSTTDDPPQVVDWKAVRFGIPTTEGARDQLMLLAADNEKSGSPDPVIELLMDTEQSRAQMEAERDEARAEADVLRDELKQASASQKSLPDDEELKERSLALAEKLFCFLDDRAQKDPQTGVFSKERRHYDEETRKLYSRQLAGDVAALLNALERRGWCSPEERKRLGGTMKTIERRVRLTAEYLDATGRRL